MNVLEGLEEADTDKLAEIEIISGGLCLYWPQLDADLYVPGLLDGVFGTRQWMNSLFGEDWSHAKALIKTEFRKR